MSYKIINEFTWQHIKGEFPEDYNKFRSADGYSYRIRVPKNQENKWSAKKRDKVSNACVERIEEPYNIAYIVFEYLHAKALIKLIMDLA